MSRKYLNNKWCVRCSRKEPTPYLKQHYKKLCRRCAISNVSPAIVDIGCGNGRNSEFMRKTVYDNVLSLDMVADYSRGFSCNMGQKRLPLLNNTVNIVLANYIFMFLNEREWHNVIREIKRAADPNRCAIMVELYPAKDSYTPDIKSVLKLQVELFAYLNWDKVLYSKGRFIAENRYGI